MKCYIQLKKRNEKSPSLTLEYIPRNNLVANRYFNLLKHYIDQKIPVDQQQSYWNLALKKEQKEELIRELQHHCDFVNKQEQINMNFDIDYSIDQGLLNEIHSRFELYLKALHAKEIKVTQEQEIDGSLLQINLLVHKIENFHAIERQIKERGKNGVDANFGFRFENDTYFDLESHDFDHFTEDRPFGSMNCGYNTTGKNLLHCMHDNDLDIVKTFGVSPQKTFSTEAFFWFGNSIDGDHCMEKFYRWWDQHDLSQYGYRKYDRQNSVGMIPLADLVEPDAFRNKSHWEKLLVLNQYNGVDSVYLEEVPSYQNTHSTL
ncbi:MAG: hypothetical protein CME62_03175 [Halobacteriovoraceae bacterium]|nr:hypothetical protein [Halobacteriovoraceae bacterium]|tara:strand:- start:12449 stop:13402 length:954 start_codon:yes stop_codon:yes gene_type:complete